jgi:hypothetical protein
MPSTMSAPRCCSSAGCPWTTARSAATSAKRSGECHGTCARAAKLCVAASNSAVIRSASTLVVISQASRAVKTAQTRSTAAARSTGGATPPQAYGPRRAHSGPGRRLASRATRRSAASPRSLARRFAGDVLQNRTPLRDIESGLLENSGLWDLVKSLAGYVNVIRHCRTLGAWRVAGGCSA